MQKRVIKYSDFCKDCVNHIHENLEEIGEQVRNKSRAVFKQAEIKLILDRALKKDDAQEILEHIREGKLIEEKKGEGDNTAFTYIKNNPVLSFYEYVLLQDPNRTYNKGYFDKMVQELIDRMINLNLFFIEAYFLYSAISHLTNGYPLSLQKNESIRFNNFITISKETEKIKLGINEEGFRSFKSFKGEIVISFYKGGSLLYSKQLKRIGNTKSLREEAYEDKFLNEVMIDDDSQKKIKEIDKRISEVTKKGSQLVKFLDLFNLVPT